MQKVLLNVSANPFAHTWYLESVFLLCDTWRMIYTMSHFRRVTIIDHDGFRDARPVYKVDSDKVRDSQGCEVVN